MLMLFGNALMVSDVLLVVLWKEQVGQIGVATIKETFDAVLHAVNFNTFFVRARDNSRQRRVDCNRWTARLTDEYFSNLTHVTPRVSIDGQNRERLRLYVVYLGESDAESAEHLSIQGLQLPLKLSLQPSPKIAKDTKRHTLENYTK